MNMKAIKANLLYDGCGKEPVKDVFVTFDKKISAVTSSKPDCEIIGEGVVTPAFIDAHCHIGMTRAGEPSSEEESNDEMQAISPINDAMDSIYMDDPSFKDSVEWGVLYSHVMPGSGNIIGGKTVLIRNWASDIEDALVKHIGMKAALGYNPRSMTKWKGERPTTRMGAIGLLRRELYKVMKARDLLKKKKKVVEEIDPITEALMEIVDGQLPLMVHVHKADDVLILKRLIDEFGINAIANHCADIHSESMWKKIKRAGLPVIYGPIDSFAHKVELKHGSWKNVGQLVKIAPKFGLMSDHPVMCQRNLFLQLRYFVRFGMSRAEAIGIITRNNAEILGLKDLGTVENGKLASLVLWNEDPFKLESYPLMAIGEGDILYCMKSD